MQNKLLNISQKDHDKRRGCRFWLKRIKGGGFHKARARGKKPVLFALIIFFTALIWSYEPHLATLLSPQEQFGLPTPDASQDAVRQDHAVRKPFRIRSEIEDKSRPLIVEKTSYRAQEAPVSKGSYYATEGFLATKKEDKEFGKDSKSSFDKKEMEDKPKQLMETVQNTKPVDKESSTSKRSSTTQGSYDTGESLARRKEDKDSSSTFKNKETTDKSKPVAQNVQNTKLVDDEPSTSKGSSSTQVSSMTKESTATKGSYAAQESIARQREDKYSSSTFKKKAEDVPKPDDLPVQEAVLVDKETKDKPKSPSNKIENTKPSAKQSFTSEGSLATQGFWADEGHSTSNGSSPSKGPLTTDKGDKVSTFTHEKKDIAKSDDSHVQEPLLISREKEDKPKTQTNSIVEDSKPVAKESSVSKESSATQGSAVTEGPSAISKDSSPTKGSLEAGKNDKVSAYIYEKKDVTKSEDRTVQEPLITQSQTKGKPMTQLDKDNIEHRKPTAKESFASNESSATQSSSEWASTTNGSSEWASTTNGSSTTAGSPETKMEAKVFASTSDKKVCNYAKGRWVYDSKRPLYSGLKCKQWLPWMFACRLTVRPDFHFEQFRWQPENCDMPEFERSSFLKRMKNKTIAFVGDSLGRQQFHSFMCMLTGGEESPEVEDVSHEYGVRPKNAAVRFPQTNTTILYYWSSCLCDLVRLNTSDPNAGVAMHLDRPPSFLKDNINKFDVLVLNTGHHWHRGKFNLNRWVMHLDGKPNEDKTLFNIGNAKNFTIFNIVRWVDSRLQSHPRGLKAFFRTISPRHFFGGDWNTGGSCENTTPLVRGSEVKQDESSDQLVANAVKGTKVNLLDITALSALRDEGHVSKYGHKADSGVRDCLHWCLPGIPDTWNEILAAQI